MAVINGTAGNDTKFGTALDDRMFGFGGNDSLYGGGARDVVYGGDGNDTLEGGPGYDTLFGDAGRDLLIGGPDRDYLDGGAGVDAARFSGRPTDYLITKISKDSYFVADQRKGRDNTDELKSIERLYFAGDNSTMYLVPNKGPVAVNDFGSGVEDSGPPITGNVLANDFEPDLDPFSITAIRTGPQFGGGTPGSLGNQLSGSYGLLTLNADGSYSYVIDNANVAVNGLNVGQSVTDFFTYTLTDSIGATSQATLSITINGVNDAPVAVDDIGNATWPVPPEEVGFEQVALGLDEGDPGSDATGNVLDNDTDVDGPTKYVLSVRTGTENGEGTAGTVGTCLAGLYGTLTLNQDGSYVYVVDAEPQGVNALAVSEDPTDYFTYVVSDGAGGTDTATLSISIGDGIGWQLVGAYKVGEGPTWSNNPPVYSANEAAAFVFGGSNADYRNSTSSTSITDSGWYDGWGEDMTVFQADYKRDYDPAGYEEPSYGSWSAYVADHEAVDGFGNYGGNSPSDPEYIYINYVYREVATFQGSSASNTFVGSGAAEKFISGGGTDSFTGGGDEDFYVLSPTGNVTVTDFVAGEDTLVFVASEFGGGLIAGGLGTQQFSQAATVAFTTPAQRFFFDTDDNLLYYDADGSGGGSAQVIATLSGVTSLSQFDLSVI